MPKLVVELIQHTPIYHFQNEDGAGIRGTELKPALDRFLLRHAADQVSVWKIQDNDSTKTIDALDYRVVINSKNQTRVTNAQWSKIGVYSPRQSEDKKPSVRMESKGVEVTFYSAHAALLERLEEWVGPFFACNNFGYQKTKGFGSYTVKKIKNEPYSVNVEDDIEKGLGNSWTLFESPSARGPWEQALLAGATMRKAAKRVIWIDERRKESPFLIKPVSQGNNWRIFYLPRMINLNDSELCLSEKIHLGSNRFRYTNTIRIETQADYENILKQILNGMCEANQLREVKKDE